MNDDLRVRFQRAYNVRASTAKRDHLTDDAVTSLPKKRREREHRGNRDRAEFSIDQAGEDDEENKGEQNENTPTERTGGDGPVDDATTPPESDKDHGPGSLLDVEA